jgi:hypothetical protein
MAYTQVQLTFSGVQRMIQRPQADRVSLFSNAARRYVNQSYATGMLTEATRYYRTRNGRATVSHEKRIAD